jgi:hypothetical protein
VSCGGHEEVARDDDCGRGKGVRAETSIYISTVDHIPLGLGQERLDLVQIQISCPSSS